MPKISSKSKSANLLISRIEFSLFYSTMPTPYSCCKELSLDYLVNLTFSSKYSLYIHAYRSYDLVTTEADYKLVHLALYLIIMIL